MENNSDASADSNLFRSFIEIIPAYLGVLVVFIYPLGLAMLSVQLWRGYVPDPLMALYAASVVPTPVVAGRAIVNIGLLALISFAAMYQVMLALRVRYTISEEAKLIEEAKQDVVVGVEDQHLLRPKSASVSMFSGGSCLRL